MSNSTRVKQLNERDALGLPKKEPIYAEEHASNPRLQDASGDSGLQDAPGEPRLQGAPRASQLSAERADPIPDEVVAAPNRTHVRRTDVRIGQEPRRITSSQNNPEVLHALVADSDPRSYREALDCPLPKY